MELWQKFLKTLAPHSQVSVIGPLQKTPFAAAGPTIYVDGGTALRGPTQSRFPTISVGDGDSFAGALDVTLPKDKDFSDLGFVLRNLPTHLQRVDLHGFLGGRTDHLLANLGEAQRFLKNAKQFTTLRFDAAVIGFAGGALELDVRGTFSLLVIERAQTTVTGACKFQLKEPTWLDPLSSHGLSNEGAGGVIITCDGPCFLFLGQSQKQ